jgi:thiosulfate dehydrogenase
VGEVHLARENETAHAAGNDERAEDRAMRLPACLTCAAVALAAGVALTTSVPAADVPQVDLTGWVAPKIRTVGDDALGKLVKYGYELMTNTANHIGPSVADPAMRYSGNNLTCQNCHLQAGTQPYAMPLTGVWGQFPQYRGREGEIGTLEERINGCMDRSMNGLPLPLDGREMKAFLAYMKWLSTGVADGAKLVGAGTMRLAKEPDRAADLGHGAQVFARTCAMCHGKDGQGQRAATGAGYQFPPLWGLDSYNDGAGMTRVLTAAAFVQHNMPLGTTYDAPALSDDEAYDVAAYINSTARPAKAGLDKDFPNKLQKPVDTPYGPYVDGFPAEQHKYGPFDPIRARLKDIAAAKK